MKVKTLEELVSHLLLLETEKDIILIDDIIIDKDLYIIINGDNRQSTYACGDKILTIKYRSDKGQTFKLEEVYYSSKEVKDKDIIFEELGEIDSFLEKKDNEGLSEYLNSIKHKDDYKMFDRKTLTWKQWKI